MAHTLELMEKVKEDVLKTYPHGEYYVLIDKPLAGKNIKYRPDIQIMAGGSVICAVEIGYTRPEKLKAYQKKNIPDIRWYSKEGKLLQRLRPSSSNLRYKFSDLPSHQLLLLQMELRAIRDRVIADLDAALAKVEQAMPEPEQSDQMKSMKTWTPERWREFLGTGK